MDEGVGFAEAVALAQRRGFAEADPAMDLGGEDAMQKLRILAALAFEEPVRKVTIVGLMGSGRPGRTDRPSRPVVAIRARRPDRARGTRAPEYVTRQIAEARRVAGGIELVVEPRQIPRTDPLARVVDEQNAVVIRGRAVGDVWLSGRGAGSLPTAAALLSDILNLT